MRDIAAEGYFHHAQRCLNCGSTDISHHNSQGFVCYGCGTKTIFAEKEA